jgi:anti-sigma factor RsiW
MARQSSCEDPANELLPWYLNGSLAAEEEASVRAHVALCPVCSRELRELGEVAGAVALHGSDIALPPPVPLRRGFSARIATGLAAVLMIPAALGIYWASRGFPLDREPARPGFHPAVILSLGAGPGRGEAALPELSPPPGVESVTVVFSVPLSLDVRYVIELRSPSGEMVASGKSTPDRDALGQAAYTFPAKALRSPGVHVLVVRDIRGVGGEGTYQFPFRVKELAAPSP